MGGLDDLDGTLAQVTDEAPVILLAHEPDIFRRCLAGRIDAIRSHPWRTGALLPATRPVVAVAFR